MSSLFYKTYLVDSFLVHLNVYFNLKLLEYQVGTNVRTNED